MPLNSNEYPENFPVLKQALDSTITRLSVEFHPSHFQLKPNVVFKFNFEPTPAAIKTNSRGQTILHIGCSMAVRAPPLDATNGRQAAGECIIEVVSHTARSLNARAAFNLEVKDHYTLRDVVNVIRGRHDGLPTEMRHDLSSFSFLSVSSVPLRPLRGTRDWM